MTAILFEIQKLELTQCSLWHRRCSDPTCNAGNASRLWFVLLGSGQGSRLLAEKSLQLTQQEDCTAPGKQWSSAPRAPWPGCACPGRVWCRERCTCQHQHCKTTRPRWWGWASCRPGTRSACPCTSQPACPASWSPPRPPPAAGGPASSPNLSGLWSQRAPPETNVEGHLQLSSLSGSPASK